MFEKVFNWPGFYLLSWVGRLILLTAIAVAFLTQNIFGLITLFVFLVLSLLLLKVKDYVPSFAVFLFIFASIMNGLVWLNSLNSQYPVLDAISHFYTPFVVTLVLGFLIRGYVGKQFEAYKKLFLLLIVCLGISIGVGWEVYEWAVDLVAEDLPITYVDTIRDLITDSLGAASAALFLSLFSGRK